MKYRKKPLEIEAVQFSPENEEEIKEFLDGAEFAVTDYNNKILLRTLEGVMEGYRGDWVIKGIQGEFYICKNDIFEETYEPVHLEEPLSPEKTSSAWDQVELLD